MRYLPFIVLALLAMPSGSFASAKPIESVCAVQITSLSTIKQNAERFDAFIKFYKNPNLTPDQIQAESTRIVKNLSETQDPYALSTFLLDMESIKPPSRFNQIRRYYKYGSFFAFDSVKAFVKEDGSLELPPQVSPEVRLVLFAIIARHLERDVVRYSDIGVLSFDQRTKLFLQLIEAIKVDKNVETSARLLLYKRRLAYEVTRAYEAQLDPAGRDSIADKVTLARELKEAINSLPVQLGAKENFNDMLLEKIP